MKSDLIPSLATVKAVLCSPATPESTSQIPADYLKDPAPLNAVDWHREMDVHMAHQRRADGSSCVISLLYLARHLPGLPDADRPSCLQRILDAMPGCERVSLQLLLRTTHQILQLPASDQPVLLSKLAQFVPPSLRGIHRIDRRRQAVEKMFGTPALSANRQATARSRSNRMIRDLPDNWGAADGPSQPAHKRKLDQTDFELPFQLGDLDVEFDLAQLETELQASSGPAAVQAPVMPETFDVDIQAPGDFDFTAFEEMISSLDKSMLDEWNRNFDFLDRSVGPCAERNDLLTTLLTDMANLASCDLLPCLLKLSTVMKRERHVELPHAKQLWAYIKGLPASPSRCELKQEIGRIALHWAADTNWSVAEIVEVSDMLNL